MKKEIITRLKGNFDNYTYKKENIEFWFARDLQKLLGYSKWENFTKVIEKAKESCKNSEFNILDHFPDVRKKVKLGSEAEREIKDYILTRYACYLIAQNGDSRKQEIAFAQSYFAIQTRKQELIEERIKLTDRLNVPNSTRLNHIFHLLINPLTRHLLVRLINSKNLINL